MVEGLSILIYDSNSLNSIVIRWTKQDEALAITLLKDGKTYLDISKLLNRSEKSTKEKLLKLGYNYSQFIIPEAPKYCECCGKEIINHGIKFCSKSCSAKINNQKFPKRIKMLKPIKTITPKEVKTCICCGNECKNKFCSLICQQAHARTIRIENWKSGSDLGHCGKTISLKRFIRKYLIEKADFKCSKCSWNEIHTITGTCPLEINHIDGDATNCVESNLEVICPNCHSLTLNFRALNKSSKRVR